MTNYADSHAEDRILGVNQGESKHRQEKALEGQL